MPHFPKPFFREDRQLWYVQINGRQFNLGRDQDAAFAKYHELMRAPEPVASTLVVGIIDGFLDWCQKHRARRTYDGHLWHLQRFVKQLPNAKTMTVDELKPYHVVAWVDAHPDWGRTYRRNAITSVQRAFLWAEKMGHIIKSPIRHVEKPMPDRREQVIPEPEFRTIIATVKRPYFRDLIEFCWETGARPQEARLAEARHLNLERGRLEFPPKESKGKKRWRLVYLTPRAQEIVTALAAKHPNGPLFRNSDGTAWTTYSINCAFCRLQETLARKSGRAEPEAAAVKQFATSLKPTKIVKGKEVTKSEKDLLCEARKKLRSKAARGSTKYALYSLRHSFATRLLEAGVDPLTVSALLGHADGSMLARVSSHLGESVDYLRDTLHRVAGVKAEDAAT